MTHRHEPETLTEASRVAALKVKTTANLLGIGENQCRAALQRGEIPGLRIVGGRWLVLTAPFLAWCRDEADR